MNRYNIFARTDIFYHHYIIYADSKEEAYNQFMAEYGWIYDVRVAYILREEI